jgi:hypothetical protein
LWVSNEQYPYVATKPIHGSQREIKGDRLKELKELYAILGEGHFIELECIINYELKQLLMSMMDRLVVLTPKTLCADFHEKVGRLSRMYEQITSI